MGRRVLRRVLRRGSKKGLSRRHLEGRSTPFREYNPVGVCPKPGKHFYTGLANLEKVDPPEVLPPGPDVYRSAIDCDCGCNFLRSVPFRELHETLAGQVSNAGLVSEPSCPQGLESNWKSKRSTSIPNHYFQPLPGAPTSRCIYGFRWTLNVQNLILETFSWTAPFFSGTKKQPKEEVFGPDIPRTSVGHSRGYPGSKLRSGPSKPWKTSISERTSMTHFGTDVHDPKGLPRTSVRKTLG